MKSRCNLNIELLPWEFRLEASLRHWILSLELIVNASRACVSIRDSDLIWTAQSATAICDYGSIFTNGSHLLAP